MPDKVFVDTNVLIYFISSEESKKTRAKEVIFSGQEVYVSSQIIAEFISVCISKNLLPIDEIAGLVDNFLESLRFSCVEEITIKKALQLKKTLEYSYWDSLVMASALESNCSVLYTEDMQDSQTIENRLTIVNPFKV